MNINWIIDYLEKEIEKNYEIMEETQQIDFKSMEIDNLFRKVMIEGKTENLPKDDGYYIASCKDYAVLEFYYDKKVKRDWLKDIDWYLQPLSSDDKLREKRELMIKNEKHICDIDQIIFNSDDEKRVEDFLDQREG